MTPNRYGPPGRAVGESPRRSSEVRRSSSGLSKAGSLDRLSAGFSKLQGPSASGAAAAGSLAKNGAALPYNMAQR